MLNADRSSIVFTAHMHDWEGINLKEMLQKKYKLPVYIEQKNNLAVFAEYSRVRQQGKRNVLFLRIDSGVGMGMILDGRLYTGGKGMSGEIGHTIVAANGRLCQCGNKGCLEQYISTEAIIKRVKEVLQRSHFVSYPTPGVSSHILTRSEDQAERSAFQFTDTIPGDRIFGR